MKSVAFIGNYAPRACGIATFTLDLRASLLASRPGLSSDVVMVSDDPSAYHYPQEVRLVLAQRDRADYRRVAYSLNRLGVSCVSVQHEFGIYGGPDGEWIIDLLQELNMPIVTTCHTLLADPTDGQRRVLRHLARMSAHLVVMTQKGRELLREVYEVSDAMISVIPHGIPETRTTPEDRDVARKYLGWSGHSVLLTFGLLSPNKGIEYAIRAIPHIIRDHPNTLYVVVGATHPNLVRDQGENYREKLQHLAESLGVAKHLQFVNRFVSRDELVRLINAADIYLTPYLSETQITSGTLAIAYGMGKPVVSTPYWHAAELLADGAGVLVPFKNSIDLGRATSALLSDPAWRDRLSQQAWEHGRKMTWPCVGRGYLDVLDRAATPAPRKVQEPERHGGKSTPAFPGRAAASETPGCPLALSHLIRISGRLGIYQHARITDPDPSHGFCLDDNARALIFLTSLSQTRCSRPAALDQLARRCLISLFQGFNHRLWRFRNFMDADGVWLEQAGSEDSHGRTLWALGHLLATDPPPALREALAHLFLQGCARVTEFSFPRAWAFALLGLYGYLEVSPDNQVLRALQKELAGRLLQQYRRCAAPGWEWFENVVTYDNAKLSQALLVTGRQLRRSDYFSAGLASLEFLVRSQTTRAGHFRPVGCQGFWQRGRPPAQFDQQPLEAQAMVAGCLEAHRATGDPSWLATARRIHAWFHGANDLGLPLADTATGGCHDGLQMNGVNANQGAESTLAYLQATVDLIRHAQDDHGVVEESPANSSSGNLLSSVVPAA